MIHAGVLMNYQNLFPVSYDEVIHYKKVCRKWWFFSCNGDAKTSIYLMGCIDEKNTFHSMEIITASVENAGFSYARIAREKWKFMSETNAGKAMNIQQNIQYGQKALSLTKFNPIKDLDTYLFTIYKSRKFDPFWQMEHLFKQQLNWSVFLHWHVNGNHSVKATVNFLPIINLTKETWNRCLSIIDLTFH